MDSVFGTRGRFDDFATQGDNRRSIRHHSDPIDLSESTGAHQNLVWCRFQHFIHQTLNRLRTHWSSHKAKVQNRVVESFDGSHTFWTRITSNRFSFDRLWIKRNSFWINLDSRCVCDCSHRIYVSELEADFKNSWNINSTSCCSQEKILPKIVCG